jgi:hypothetical protein
MNTTGLIVFPVLFVAFFIFEWMRLRSRSERDVEWEREMRATPWRDRRRIAQSVRRGERLSNPREARLAVGMAEDQEQMTTSLRSLPKVKLALGGALALLGLVGGAWTVVGLGVFILLLGAGQQAYDARLRRRIEQAERANREQASLEAQPPGH